METQASNAICLGGPCHGRLTHIDQDIGRVDVSLPPPDGGTTGYHVTKERIHHPSCRSPLIVLHWNHPLPAHDCPGPSGMMILEREFDAMRSWQTWRRTDPLEWRKAGGFNQGTAWLTVDELAEMEAEFTAIVMRHRERLSDPATRPEGARLIRLLTWTVPATPLADPPAESPEPRGES